MRTVAAMAPHAPTPGALPVPRRRPSPAEIFPIVVRNLVPLAGLLVFRGSVEDFLLLCVFNEAYALACLGVVGVAVSTRDTRIGTGMADLVAAWSTLAVVGIGATLLLTVLFGWVVALMAAQSPLGLWNAELGWSLAAIVAASLFSLAQQYRQDVASGASEALRRKRDQPLVGGHLFSAGIIFILAGYAAQWGLAGATVMAFAVTALFVFRDLRPDLMQDVAAGGFPK